MEEGKEVLIELPNGHLQRVQIPSGGETHSLGRYGSIKLDVLKRLPAYDYFYDLDTDTFHPQNPHTSNRMSEEMLPNDTLVDDNTAQKYTLEEITEMKTKATGKEVVEALVAGSNTFDLKNAHAQDKYLKRKQAKYLRVIRIREYRALDLLRMMTMQGKQDKIGYLRADTLSLIALSAHGRIGVVDEYGGVVLQALMERNSHVVALYMGQQLNVPQVCRNLEPMNLKAQTLLLESYPQPEENSTPKFMERWTRYKQSFDLLKERMDTLVIISATPQEALKVLGPCLGGSGTLIVYSPTREPLMPVFEGMLHAEGEREWVDVRLTETWLRKYQTEAGRMHPMMGMNGHTGTILTAIKKQQSQ